MQTSVFHFSLDVHGADSQGMLHVKQGDTARGLRISLTQKGLPYVVPSDCLAVFSARKPDGTALYQECRIEQGLIHYDFTEQTAACAGELLCELRLYGGNGQLLTSPRFSILIAETVYQDGEIIESAGEFSALTRLVEETQAIKAQWEALLESGQTALALSDQLKSFDSALQAFSDSDIVGLPVFDPDQKPEFVHMQLLRTDGEENQPLFSVPSEGTAREMIGAALPDGLLLQDGRLYLAKDGEIMGEGAAVAGESGLVFDSGFVDEKGLLHLTAGGKEIEGFTPFYIGSAAECANGLLIEGNTLYLARNGETIGEGVPLPEGGGGSGSGSTLKLLSRNPSSAFSVMDTAEEALILYQWSSVDSEDGSSTGKGSASWYVNDKRVAAQSVEQGEGSFNVMPYLENGAENTVKLILEDAYGASRTRTWTVTVISFGLTWNLESMSCHPSEAMSLQLIPTGIGEKILRVTLDGESLHSSTVSTSGRSVTVELPALSHGVHTLRAWLELMADGESISTEPLTHVGIWYEEGNSNPVVAVLQDSVEISQYATAALSYLVYDPLTETARIDLYENDSLLRSLSVGRGQQNWAYRPTVQGVQSLRIAVAETEAEAQITVTVTELGYDIAPVTAGLILDCDPAGHSNSESTREDFGYSDKSGANHPFTFSEHFDWVNGGFQTDTEGITALVIKRGSYVTLDRSFFDADASSKGRELKIVCKAVNCRDYEAEFLSCVHEGVGLRLQAQQGVLSSESQSIVFPYCEEEKLEIDLNIASNAEQRLATVWLHGVPSAAFVYAGTDSWAQASPQSVRIGSEDCDLWLYKLRLYENSLTRYDILANYIADAGTTEKMIERYERNDIYNADGSVSLTKLRDRNPELRVIHISAEAMTTSKNDVIPCSVELLHRNGKGFTATGVSMKAQGTSSLEYGLAALNLDLDFSEAQWQNDAGEAITGFSIGESSIPVNYFNIKLNVASSENANNVCLADDYNQFQPYLCPARQADPRVRDTVEGKPCAVFLTNTAKTAIPVGARTLPAGQTMLYGCGDMNNSKKNFAVFGQGGDELQCCIEILNNNNDPCRFVSDDLSAETWDGAEGTSDFEFRYPKKPTQAMKDAFQAMLSWVVSTNPATAGGNALTRPVQYEGVTYNNDTGAYRLAKFRNELKDYFSVDSLLYHYLFTEYHLMVDNRAKNTFVSYEYDESAGAYRWNFCKDYDNDTAAGTDNAGGLTFRYGLEDTDSVGAQKVYNASDSVLWCNLRDTMGEELKAMFYTLESAKCWDTERILQKFKTYQSARPETLVAEDMWAKYFMPYLNAGEQRYLEMAQGTKEDQRARFYRYQRPYISSKYLSSYASSDSLSLRINAVSDLQITPYSDVYVCVKFGNAGLVRVRAKRGQAADIPCNADTSNDLETYLYSAGSLSRLGDLSGLQASEIELNSAVKLRNLPLGSSEIGYENSDLTQLSFGTIRNLEEIDLSGLSSLTGTLDLTQFDALTRLHASGSSISGVIFAPNAPVVTAILPKVTTLVLRGQRALQTLSVDASKLKNLRVEDTPRADTLAMVRAATGLQRGRLTKVQWDGADTDTLLRLAGLSGYDEENRPVERFVLSGSAHVDKIAQEELELLHETFPNLELSYASVVPSYTVTFQNEDGTLLHSQTVRQGGSATEPVSAGLISTPTKEPTVGEVFRFAGWDFPLTNITGDTVLTAIYASSVRCYTIRWFDGSRLLQTDMVEAYDSVTYKGSDLSSTETDVIWVGWDKTDAELLSVEKDMDVYAAYLSPQLPTAVAADFDYLYSDDPADKSGYSLAEFYGIIHSGKAKEFFQVGDQIKLCVNSSAFTDTQFVMQLLGFKHYRLADGSGDFAKVVFGLIGVMDAEMPISYGSTNTVTNVGGWEITKVRDYLEDQVFSALPIRWKSLIRSVQVLASAGNTSAEILVSEDHLFLLSAAEVGLYTTDVPYSNEVDAEAEKMTFELFTSAESRIRKRYNGAGAASNWWLRSPKATSTKLYVCIGSHGVVMIDSLSPSYLAMGIAFAFCI